MAAGASYLAGKESINGSGQIFGPASLKISKISTCCRGSRCQKTTSHNEDNVTGPEFFYFALFYIRAFFRPC
jgi:hypothetical protein